jgi:hypothetical protein
MRMYYGVSRGESGYYGIGDIVEGISYSTDSDTGIICIGDEDVYNVFYIENNTIVYIPDPIN